MAGSGRVASASVNGQPGAATDLTPVQGRPEAAVTRSHRMRLVPVAYRVPLPGWLPVPLALPLALYMATGIALLPGWRHQLNPDGLQYVEIARRYADLRWADAINAFRSPLYSWLIAPLTKAPSDIWLLVKCLNLIIGLAALVAVWALSGRFTNRSTLRGMALVALVVPTLRWALTTITPDLLFVVVFVWYLYHATAPAYPQRLRHAVAAGVFGGIAYLVKAYALPFIFIHLLFCHVYRAPWRHSRAAHRPVQRGIEWSPAEDWSWRRRFRQLIVAITTMVVVCTPWVALISQHSGRLTYSTAGDVTWRWMGPGFYGDALSAIGLFRPGALDLDLASVPVPDWSVSVWPSRNMGHFGRLVFHNLVSAGESVVSFSLMSVVIIAVTALVLFRRPKSLDTYRERLLSTTVCAALLAPAGYCVLIINERYIWIVAVLMALAGALLLTLAQEQGTLGARGVRLLAAVMAASFWLPYGLWLVRYSGTGADDVTTSVAIRSVAPGLTGQSLATNAEPNTTQYLSYRLGTRFAGVVRKDDTGEQAANQLRAYHIAYFLYWYDGAGTRYATQEARTPTESNQLPEYLAGATAIYTDKARGMRLFRLAP